MNAEGWKTLKWVIGGLVLAAALSAPALAGERAVHVRVNEPFEMNGQRYDAGHLTLREVSSYNPMTTINEVWVDDDCLGLMLADRAATAGTGDDRVLFERDAAGTLVLVGFAYRGEPVHEFYGYQALADGGRWSRPARAVGVSVASR